MRPTDSRHAYLPFLFLAESISIQIAYVGVIALNSFTLYRVFWQSSQRNFCFVPSLILHMFVWVIVAATTLVQNSYVLVHWKMDEYMYNPKFLYISGMIYISIQCGPAIPLFFSTIDRSLALRQTPHTSPHINRVLFALAVLGTCLVIAVMLTVFVLSAPNPFPTESGCLSTPCLNEDRSVSVWHSTISWSCALLNLMAGAFLMLRVHRFRYFQAYRARRQLALLVIKVLLLQCAADLFVNAIAFSSSTVFAVEPNNVFGSYSRSFAALNGLVCAVMYAKTVCRGTWGRPWASSWVVANVVQPVISARCSSK